MLLPQLLRMTILEALRQNMIASNFIASTEFDDMDFINRELSLFLKLFIPRYEHPRRIKSLLRVTKEQFEALVEELTSDEIGLTNIRSASAHQQVAIFLFVCGQDASYRTACELFRHGPWT